MDAHSNKAPRFFETVMNNQPPKIVDAALKWCKKEHVQSMANLKELGDDEINQFCQAAGLEGMQVKLTKKRIMDIGTDAEAETPAGAKRQKATSGDNEDEAINLDLEEKKAARPAAPDKERMERPVGSLSGPPAPAPSLTAELAKAREERQVGGAHGRALPPHAVAPPPRAITSPSGKPLAMRLGPVLKSKYDSPCTWREAKISSEEKARVGGEQVWYWAEVGVVRFDGRGSLVACGDKTQVSHAMSWGHNKSAETIATKKLALSTAYATKTLVKSGLKPVGSTGYTPIGHTHDWLYVSPDDAATSTKRCEMVVGGERVALTGLRWQEVKGERRWTWSWTAQYDPATFPAAGTFLLVADQVCDLPTICPRYDLPTISYDRLTPTYMHMHMHMHMHSLSHTCMPPPRVPSWRTSAPCS